MHQLGRPPPPRAPPRPPPSTPQLREAAEHSPASRGRRYASMHQRGVPRPPGSPQRAEAVVELTVAGGGQRRAHTHQREGQRNPGVGPRRRRRPLQVAQRRPPPTLAGNDVEGMSKSKDQNFC